MPEVIALAGWPPEFIAYAFAMYSRSKLSIRESIKKVTEEKSGKFFETYYFQYGHASIADNAHIPLAMEGIPEIAAYEIEDEQLWDGQERSTRYQSFDGDGVYFVPAFVRHTPYQGPYETIADFLLTKYRQYSKECFEHLHKRHPCPADMPEDAYERTLKARAFDVSRYWLFNGILTSVGQITSARTLERQISRLLASEYYDVVELAKQIKEACSAKPFCPEGKDEPSVAPTLVKYANVNGYMVRLRAFMDVFMKEKGLFGINPDNPLLAENYTMLMPRFDDLRREILTSLIYQESQLPYRMVYDIVKRMGEHEVVDLVSAAHALRDKHDELPRTFAAGPAIQFDVCMDIGGRRDLHRHRNCIQIHQKFTVQRGFDVPALVTEMGWEEDYVNNMTHVAQRIEELSRGVGNNADYLIPFAFRAGTVYKMDYRQCEYLTALRSGPAVHFSCRKVVCSMDEQVRASVFPGLDPHSRVTPFDQEDIFKR